MIEQYIGIPYSYTNDGGHNCLTFFTFIQNKVYHKNVGHVIHNTLNVLHNKEFNNWIKIDEPVDGCGVIMARSRVPIHIGTYIAREAAVGILHCYNGLGSILSPVDLSDINMCVIDYYEHRDHLA